ncbi:Origin recognition complex subunit 2 [Lignoscripta atroalba]|nr:Origin recognition complex subunit 2 [Lignoscripta atroalba]
MTAKRKRETAGAEQVDDYGSSPKRARSGENTVNGEDELSLEACTPSKRPRGRPRKNDAQQRTGDKVQAQLRTDIITPRSKGKVLFTAPAEPREGCLYDAPSSLVQNADRSARRKSVRKLIERTITGNLSEDNDLDEDHSLAKRIWDPDEPGDDVAQEDAEDESEGEEILPQTPSKRGRPKGARKKRSPTPPQNLPPYEQYFYQNRPGSKKTSSNTLSSLSLLSHSEYHDRITTYSEPHKSSISFLHSLHSRSFPQWVFELAQSFSVCLYGYGSKRSLVDSFATYLHSLQPASSPPTTVIINGYAPTLNLRHILSTICNAAFGSLATPKLPLQPAELLDSILTHLTAHPPTSPIYIMVNSLDASLLRRAQVQSIIAHLSAHKSIHLLATCDTPSFPLLWDNGLREHYNWIFHDTTTFVPYDDGKGTGEVGGVVDVVNELMGRKGGSGKGRDGVRWVLKSLPENARGLYRILIAELLSVTTEDNEGRVVDESDDSVENNDRTINGTKPAHKNPSGEELAGIEYRTLYQKAVEEFLCSSEMAFRTLLKEFHDHQMIVSRKDGAGTEVLGVPLRREEMEALLEDLMG